MRRLIVIALALLLPLMARAAELADATGRHVALPEHIARVLPAGPPAAVLLAALAPDAMIGWPMRLAPEARAALDPITAKLPEIPRLTGKEDVTEAVRALAPDLIVDYGTVAPEYTGLAQRTQERTGIPTVLLDGALSAIPSVLRTLGAALHRPERAEALAREAEAVLALPPPARALRIVYARGPDATLLTAPGAGAAEVFERLGWPLLVPSGAGHSRVTTPEQIAALHPDVIILADPDALARVREWPGLGTARVLADPGRPFGWIAEPPSLNRLLGLIWLRGLAASP
jgi:iron complex transport system substrate-binding protein